jgi:hypothetical protein
MIDPIDGTEDNAVGQIMLYQIEALDTLHIMGYNKWYKDALDYILDNGGPDGEWQDHNLFMLTT